MNTVRGRGGPQHNAAPDLLQRNLQQALTLHQKGQLAEAGKIYQTILQLKPDNFDALHLLGLIAYQTGELDRAEELIARAVKLNRKDPAAHSNRGLVLHGLKRLSDAVASYDRAIALKPDYAEAYFNRGNAFIGLELFHRALSSYDRAIAIRPDYAEAHSNRGNTLRELKRFDDALASYDRAIAIRPNFAAAHSNRGNTLRDLRRSEEAVAAYDRAVAIQPDYAEAWSNRGNALNDVGRPEEALASYDRAVAIQPDYAEAWSNRGNTLKDLKRLAEALASHDKAVALKPGYAEAHANRGSVLRELERFDEALASFDQAMASKPDLAEAWSSRGNTLKDLGRYNEAFASFDRAVAIKPDLADAHFGRANALDDLGRLDDALACYDRTIAIKPDHAEAYSNRGNALKQLGRLDEAVASYDEAIAINPKFAEAHSNRGVALRGQGMLDEAEKSYRRAIALKPDLAEAYGNLGTVLTDQCQLDEAVDRYDRALALNPRSQNAWRGLTTALVYHPEWSADARFARQQQFGLQMAKNVAGRPALPANDRNPERRLRIGWLSSDFRRHPVGRNLQPFFEHRDRSRFEAVCYAEVKAPDEVTGWLRDHSDEWHSTAGLSDAAVAERIRSDRIDIMIYLAGRFDDNRVHVAAWRPAPVQISMFDVATSGIAAMDYLVADRLMVPRHGPEKFTERVLRLPNTYVHPPIDDAPQVVAPPSQANGYATFGCFNNPTKVNDRVLELWAELLARVPRSRLALKYGNHYQSDRLRERVERIMGRHGVERSRFDLEGKYEDAITHFTRYGGIDIALDPFPFNGSTTTFESLWMGVPVVTLEGESLVSRWSSAQLRHVGLDELVARTAGDYVGLAAELAGDGPRLASLRSRLRQRVRASALCDARRTTRHLERSLRVTWRAWCADRFDPGQISGGR